MYNYCSNLPQISFNRAGGRKIVDAHGSVECGPKLFLQALGLWTDLGLELGEMTWFSIVLTQIINLGHYLEFFLF